MRKVLKKCESALQTVRLSFSESRIHPTEMIFIVYSIAGIAFESKINFEGAQQQPFLHSTVFIGKTIDHIFWKVLKKCDSALQTVRLSFSESQIHPTDVICIGYSSAGIAF